MHSAYPLRAIVARALLNNQEGRGGGTVGKKIFPRNLFPRIGKTIGYSANDSALSTNTFRSLRSPGGVEFNESRS